MTFAPPRPILSEDAAPVPARAGTALHSGALAVHEAAPQGAAVTAGNWLPGRLAPPQAAAPGLRLLPAAGFAWSGPRGLPRTRPDHVLIWLTAGEAMLRLPRTESPAPALLFLPAGTAFAWQPSPGAEGWVLLLGRDLAERADTPFPGRPVEAAPGGPEIVGLHADLAAVAAEAQREDAGAPRALALRLGAVAARLGRLAAEARPQPDPLATRFLVLAARELPRGRSLAELAAALGCTIPALDRACIARHGKRAADLLARLRIDRAAELLEVTDLPASRIASEAGFADAEAMRAALHQAAGTSPMATRRA